MPVRPSPSSPARARIVQREARAWARIDTDARRRKLSRSFAGAYDPIRDWAGRAIVRLRGFLGNSPPQRNPSLRHLGRQLRDPRMTPIREASKRSASRAAREPLWAREIESCLFNAARMHCLPGRKTYMLDCRWWQLLNHPSLPGLAFKPELSRQTVEPLLQERWNSTRDAVSVNGGPCGQRPRSRHAPVRHARSCAASDLCRGGERRLTLTYDSSAYCDG